MIQVPQYPSLLEFRASERGYFCARILIQVPQRPLITGDYITSSSFLRGSTMGIKFPIFVSIMALKRRKTRTGKNEL